MGHQKQRQQKKQLDELDNIKIKNFGVLKNTVNRVKRQLKEWKETSENHISEKGLISKIHNELLKINKKNPKLVQKRAKDLNDISPNSE